MQWPPTQSALMASPLGPSSMVVTTRMAASMIAASELTQESLSWLDRK